MHCNDSLDLYNVIKCLPDMQQSSGPGGFGGPLMISGEVLISLRLSIWFERVYRSSWARDVGGELLIWLLVNWWRRFKSELSIGRQDDPKWGFGFAGESDFSSPGATPFGGLGTSTYASRLDLVLCERHGRPRRVLLTRPGMRERIWNFSACKNEGCS
jgi:hypothetical protein